MNNKITYKKKKQFRKIGIYVGNQIRWHVYYVGRVCIKPDIAVRHP